MQLWFRLCLLAPAAAALKVTVLGGSGFVGSRVCKALVQAGAEVLAVSKSGKAPDWCESEEWTRQVEWRANELTRGSREALAAAIGQPDAIVSSVGAIGFDRQELLQGNGVANREAAAAARVAGAQRACYVSVSSEVVGSAGWLPSFFSGYFEGKQAAEEAITAEFGAENVCIVRPSFIYGGDAFGLFPPRVSAWYGAFIEELLSQGLFVKGADVLPGLLGVALRPPVSVDAIAAACAAHALGKCTAAELDGTAAINEVAGLPPASGLTDALEGIKGKVAALQES